LGTPSWQVSARCAKRWAVRASNAFCGIRGPHGTQGRRHGRRTPAAIARRGSRLCSRCGTCGTPSGGGRRTCRKCRVSAAGSFEESARRHDKVAQVQDRTVEHGAPDIGVHRESASRHREAAAGDRKLAELKRKESAADLDR